MTDDEITKSKQLIRTRETEVAAQIAALLALAETGFDTSEAEVTLRREADALTALRRYQAEVVEMRDE